MLLHYFLNDVNNCHYKWGVSNFKDDSRQQKNKNKPQISSYFNSVILHLELIVLLVLILLNNCQEYLQKCLKLTSANTDVALVKLYILIIVNYNAEDA